MQRKKIQCPLCGQEISINNYSKHERRHKNHPETFVDKEVYQSDHDDLFCKFCGKECKNKNSLVQHELRCKDNPNRKDFVHENFNTKGHPSWKRGLTKETDERILKQALSVKEFYKTHDGTFKGKKHKEESKLKISIARKQYLSENPDKVPYLINHSSNESYPERYFKEVFANEGLPLEYHKQVSKYELDFYNEEFKLDVEIDGEQHYLDKRISNSDIDRDEYMKNLGWKVYRIRWSDYKKLSKEEKDKIIQQIRELLN